MLIGSSYSWTILDQNTIVKNMDKSCFEDGGSVLPVKTRWFWGFESLKAGEILRLTLVYQERDYDAPVKPNNGRARMSWPGLKGVLHRLYPMYKNFIDDDYPAMVFRRAGTDRYSVSFSEETVYLPPSAISDPIAVQGRMEGQLRYIHTKAYERNPANRKACIDYHGTTCMACGFNFERVYGELGKDYIEVHHRQAVHTFDGERRVNPITDLAPVCANCHRMLHRKRDNAMSVVDLKMLLERHARR